MGTPFIVVAFYTKDTPYEKEAAGLRSSLGGLKHHIEPIENRGEWVYNCAYKPSFLLQMLRLYKDHNILYVDADARIQGDLDHFNTLDTDIAVCKREGEILSGTIFLRNCDRVISLVTKWQTVQHKEEGVWDQKVLASVLKNTPLRVSYLETKYCYIFDRDHGPATILHTQASRRHKSKVRINDDIPPTLHGVRVRRFGDGSFGIARRNRRIETEFDAKHIRIKNQLRWHRRPVEGLLLNELRPFFKGKCVHVIGKGPSLDTLDLSGVAGPIVAINDAIHKVEELNPPVPLFAIQQDETLGRACTPQRAILIISRQAVIHYNDVQNKSVYCPEDYEESTSSITAVCLIKLALSLGATEFKFYCFDACMNENVTYAKCIGHDPGPNAERFLKHRRYIERVGAKVTFVGEDDTPEPSVEHPEEHGEDWLVPDQSIAQD